MNIRVKPLALSAALAAASSLGLLAAPAIAHHSFAMFDKDHPGSMTGTVKQLNWSNPHIALMVYRDVKPGEAPQLWTFESGAPGNLNRAGWTSHSINPGDKVRVDYQPLRDGGNAGEVIKVTQLASGKIVSAGEK